MGSGIFLYFYVKSSTMALIQLGAMFSAISGKVGGQSISNRKQTTTIRNITYSNKTPTIKQSLQRFITGVISNSYQFITSAQRAIWQTAALDYTYVNRVGDTVTRNGFQTFSFLNQNLSLIDKPLLSVAPLYVPVTEPKINIVDISTGKFKIQSNNASNDYLYALFAAPNLSFGTLNAKSKMKFCGTITAAELNAGYDVISKIENVFGTIIFPNNISIIVDPINQSTGNRNQFVTEIFNEDTPMILEVTVLDGDTITIPFATGGTYNGTVDYGDGNQNTFFTWNDSNLTHTYTLGGTYIINIIGSFPKFTVNNGAFKDYLTDIIQFGSNGFTALNFRGCDLLTNPNITDTPVISTNCLIGKLFQNITNLTNFNKLNLWDTTKAIQFREMFYNLKLFTADLSLWNVSLGTDFTQMFYNAWIFESDLSAWDTSKATSFNFLFYRAKIFVSDLSAWNVSNVTNFNNCFNGAALFDSDLSGWDISKATTMTNFGSGANFSDANWDAMLIAWAALPTPPSSINFSINATHTAAANAAYATLTTTYSWTINEGV